MDVFQALVAFQFCPFLSTIVIHVPSIWHPAGINLSRYGLFRETIRKFLYTLRKQKQGLYENIKDELSKSYLDKDFDLTEKDNEKARRRVSEMATDMYKIIIAFDKSTVWNFFITFP